MSHRFEFNCPLPHGLHARPATAMAAFCEPFDARVMLRNDRNGVEASAHSVLALISADIREGDRCVVRVSGTGSETVSGALQEWIAKQLPHCDDELEANAVVSTGLPRSLAMLQPDYVGGSGLSTGIGLGQPVVLSGPRIPAELLELAGDGIDAEDRKLAAARVTAIRQVEAALAARGGAEAAVLRAHLAILQDEEYTTRLETAVREAGETAPAAAAVSAVVGHFDRLLAATGNPYLLERALDIRDVSMRLLGVIYGDVARPALPSLSVDSVVVADNLAPGDFIALRGERLKGLVLESGGRTSHTVLLARATGVPVLTGAANAVAFARGVTGPLVVDAGAGLLVDASKPAVREYYTGEQAKLDTIAARFTAHAQREARTGDGVRLEVSANIALPEEAPEVFANGAEGIGVFRTEMLFTGRQGPPGEEEQYRVYRKVADAAGDRPVIIRTFDIGGDKPVPWLQGPAEDNPFLGMRGARLYPERETEFRTQLRAMLRAAVHGGLRIMVPMISTPDELRWARSVYDDVCKTLEADGIEAAKAPFGIMLEVPSAVYSMGQLAPMSDFFSIGSNDLLQYFMAADRGNPRLGGLYDHYQPAFLRFLRELLGEAKTHGVFTGLCGDMASDERALPLLAGLGLDEISLVAPQIPRTKAALSRLDSAACTRLLDRAIACENSAAVLAELDSFQARHGGRSLFSEDLVVFAESAGSKQEAIKQLVDLAHLAGRTGNAAALETAVWQREDVFSTGLGFGIAIPHCKSAAVAHNSLCVARYTEPLDWQSRDGEPVDTVIMLIVNEHDAGEAHLKIFAQLARRIMHEEFRNGLRACADINSLLRYLVDAVED